MHPTSRRRLIPASAALALALIGSLFTASAASAAGPYDGKVVVTSGHADVLYPTVDGGEVVLRIKDETDGPAALRSPEDMVFHVRPSFENPSATPPYATTRTATAALVNAMPGFAAVGDTIYVLPRNNVAGQLFLGFGYDSAALPAGTSVTYTLTGVHGPGHLVLWQTGEEGPEQFLNSAQADTSFTSQANHEHISWGFTALGHHEVSIEADVQVPGEEAQVVSGTYTFFVGDELPGDEPVETTLAITGAAGHYHAGGVASLTAVQDPATDEDHYHWFTRAPGETDWTVVPDALGATYGFVVRAVDDGTEVIARLYDHDHAPIAESAPVTIVVDDHGSSPVEGPVISTTLEADAGSLIISVDEGHHDVQLTNLEVNPAADRYVATGEVAGIRVSDTRSEDPGWTANGRVRSFTTVDGDVLPGTNLGWTPKVLEAPDGEVSPGAPVAPLLSGGPGIGGWSALGSTEAGEGRGTAVLGADLRLEAPLSLVPGTYQGLLILTVI